jgi:hypothetical protein
LFFFVIIVVLQWASSGDKQRVYQGMFHHNQRHGHGKYTWKNLAPVENSVDDESKAEEKVQVTSISTYVGMFDNGQREGHGVYASAQIQYAGEWQNGQYHGVRCVSNRCLNGFHKKRLIFKFFYKSMECWSQQIGHIEDIFSMATRVDEGLKYPKKTVVSFMKANGLMINQS